MNNRLEAIVFGERDDRSLSATSLVPIPGKSFFSLHKSPFYVRNNAGRWTMEDPPIESKRYAFLGVSRM